MTPPSMPGGVEESACRDLFSRREDEAAEAFELAAVEAFEEAES